MTGILLTSLLLMTGLGYLIESCEIVISYHSYGQEGFKKTYKIIKKKKGDKEDEET